MKDEEPPNTTNRPWIKSEIRAWVKNPNRIIYASHMHAVSHLRYRVKHAIREVWHTTFSETALRLLFGLIGMTCLSDFKFLMPPYAQLLSMAFARMCRDDYLLTIALLICDVHQSSTTRAHIDIWECKLDQYNLREYTGGTRGIGGLMGMDMGSFDVYIGSTKVAYWICRHDRYTSTDWTAVYTLPGTERSICKAIGLGDAEWEEFAAKEDRRDFLVLNRDGNNGIADDHADRSMDDTDSDADEYSHAETTDNQESRGVRCKVIAIKGHGAVTFRSSKQGQDSS